MTSHASDLRIIFYRPRPVGRCWHYDDTPPDVMAPTMIDFYVAQIAEFWRDPYEHLARTLPVTRVRIDRPPKRTEEQREQRRLFKKAEYRLRRKKKAAKPEN